MIITDLSFRTDVHHRTLGTQLMERAGINPHLCCRIEVDEGHVEFHCLAGAENGRIIMDDAGRPARVVWAWDGHRLARR